MGFRDATIAGRTVTIPHVWRRMDAGDSGRLLLTYPPMAGALERVEERDLECGHIIASITFVDELWAVLFWQALRRKFGEGEDGCSQGGRRA